MRMPSVQADKSADKFVCIILSKHAYLNVRGMQKNPNALQERPGGKRLVTEHIFFTISSTLFSRFAVNSSARLHAMAYRLFNSIHIFHFARTEYNKCNVLHITSVIKIFHLQINADNHIIYIYDFHNYATLMKGFSHWLHPKSLSNSPSLEETNSPS